MNERRITYLIDAPSWARRKLGLLLFGCGTVLEDAGVRLLGGVKVRTTVRLQEMREEQL